MPSNTLPAPRQSAQSRKAEELQPNELLLILFKDGQPAATKVGALSKAQLTAFIDQQLA